VQRARQETTDQARQVRADDKAENAAGVGETEQDEQASDRDADGRRLWEAPPESPDEAAESEHGSDDTTHRGRDPRGDCGSRLDLSG
jgi:hypothetical protein